MHIENIGAIIPTRIYNRIIDIIHLLIQTIENATNMEETSDRSLIVLEENN